jgi:hypothetical protein
MSGPLVSASAAFVAKNSRIPSFAIEQSLRFDGSSYLLWTPSSTGDSVRKWTISLWVKQNYATGSTAKYMISAGPNTGSDTSIYPYTYDVGGIGGQYYFIQGDNTRYIRSIPKYRDESAWYHMVFQSDADNATTGDKLKIFVNGERVSTESPQNAPIAQNTYWNSANQHRIARIGNTTNWTGYMAEFHSVDNQLVDPDKFGEYDDNGIWRPTNSTASTYDVMSDTPTTNWCTSNPLLNNSSTYSDGNLVVTSTTSSTHATSTFAVSSGKWYWECTPNQANSWIGVVGTTGGGALVYDNPLGYAYGHTGNKGSNATGSTSYGGASYTGGDVIGVALNLDDGDITFYKNGASQGVAFTGLSGLFSPASSRAGAVSGTLTHTYNFGQRAFAYTPPTGFKALNTSNLPAPTVKDGSKNFNTVLYTGNGTDNHAITGVGFQPSFTWLKTRSVADNHVLHDEVRGANRQLFTNSTDFEFTSTTLLKSFDSDGFTLGTDSGANGLSRTFVAWNWLAANGTGSTNTAGSITSTVSANPSAGFSIGTYTADGTNTNKTVGHGLGVAPEFIIVKNRDTTGRHWLIWHKDFNDNDKAALFTADAPADNRFGPSAPTSTVFGLYGGQGNYNSDDHVFYAWTGVEGYSKISSWTGNGNPDGVYIHCGFSPSFIMFKRTDTTDNWVIFDTARTPNNVVQYGLFPDLSLQENYSANYSTDILSNGFKLRTQYFHNISGGNYVFIAFASNPFGGSGVNPATAR